MAAISISLHTSNFTLKKENNMLKRFSNPNESHNNIYSRLLLLLILKCMTLQPERDGARLTFMGTV